MARNTDDIRVESVQAHRKRLLQAFLLGGVAERRKLDNGLRSMVVSVVLAGVACAACVGFSFVSGLLAAPAVQNPVTVATTPSPAGR